MKVSRFDNILFSKSIIQVDLLTELDDIKKGKHKNIIKECRFFTANNNYDAYKKLKIKLPIVTFCGTFVNGRKLQNLDTYNSLMILDIDHIKVSEIQSIKEKLKTDKYIFSVWLSPSGEGLKALVRIESNPKEHKLVFGALKKYFLASYDIELDKSGNDVTRLCFVSWDEDLFLNENSQIYTEKILKEETLKKNRKKEVTSKSLTKSAFATEGLNKKEHRKIISLIIKHLKRKDLSITNSFEEWFRVAMAVSSTFSYDLGEKYYLTLCELDKEKHNEMESKNMLKYCYNNRSINLPSSISLGTIIFYAKKNGFISKKDMFSK